MFLYQLVNLVLETCFIFSKGALKIDKTWNKCLLGEIKFVSFLNIMGHDFKFRANQRFLLKLEIM
jgi:hypothetical protein